MRRHTKFDYDQVFSRHSLKLERATVLSIPGLLKALHESYNMPGCGRPDVAFLDEVADIWSWMDPHRERVIENITGNFQAHEFLFECREVGSVRRCFVSTKPYCVFPEWIDAGFPLLVSHIFSATEVRSRLHILRTKICILGQYLSEAAT